MKNNDDTNCKFTKSITDNYISYPDLDMKVR